MELSDILAEESVFYFTGIKTKAELLDRLAAEAAKVLDREPIAILETLSTREALGSTGLGNGIAIPHGKLPGLTRVAALFARLETPIEFDAVDDQPVDLVMALLAPQGAGADHLKALVSRGASAPHRADRRRPPPRRGPGKILRHPHGARDGAQSRVRLSSKCKGPPVSRRPLHFGDQAQASAAPRPRNSCPIATRPRHPRCRR